MRTALTNSAFLLCLTASFSAFPFAVQASGPRGGGVHTLATPGIRSGRGGSGGGSGFSFGSGGFSFGRGSSRMTIGAGSGGGISFGVGGRNSQIPSITVNPQGRPARHGNRGTPQVIPQAHVPRYRQPPVNQPLPTNPAPAETASQPSQPEAVGPQVRPNELPTNPDPNPIVTVPKPNATVLIGRLITQGEITRAREFFRHRLLDLSKALERRIPSVEFDLQQIASLMAEHSVSIPDQIQLVDALKSGDYETAKTIWIKLLPQLRVPFRPSRIRILILRFYVTIERGSISYPMLQELIRNLPPEAQRPSTCCGADDLIAQIQEEVRIHQAIGGTSDGFSTDVDEPNQYAKPPSNDRPHDDSSTTVPTSIIPAASFADHPSQFGKPNKPVAGFTRVQPLRQDHPDDFGKPTQSGTPTQPVASAQSGRPVSIPAGVVNIVYHPKLPDRQVVVVNAETVMIGTGGQGVFHMRRGFVAEAIGHRMGRGTALADSQSELSRSGIVLVNPTQTRVGFVFGDHEVSLQSGYQRAFTTRGVISFDRGKGDETARYTLEPGTYHFKVTANGWDLHSKKFEVVISNQGQLEPFNHIVQGRHSLLAPDETKKHTSNYPIVIRFDRGNGAETKQVRWEKSRGEILVGMNPSDNLWDLYDESTRAMRDQHGLQPVADFVPAF